MYEAKHQALLPPLRFLRRIALHLGICLALLVVSLGIGMIGYVVTERLPWIDAFLNAAMLLGGMGPVNAPVTFIGKLFAGLYALYAGLVFIVCAALVLTPVIHRTLHYFHVNEKC